MYEVESYVTPPSSLVRSLVLRLLYFAVYRNYPFDMHSRRHSFYLPIINYGNATKRCNEMKNRLLTTAEVSGVSYHLAQTFFLEVTMVHCKKIMSYGSNNTSKNRLACLSTCDLFSSDLFQVKLISSESTVTAAATAPTKFPGES